MDFDPKINYADVQDDTEQKNDDSDKADMIKLMEKVDKQKLTSKSSDNETEDDNDDVKEREKVILIINRYKNSSRFSKILKELKIDNQDLTNMNMKKLNGLLDKIRFNLDNSQNNDFINTAIFAGIGSSEKLATNLQLEKIRGFNTKSNGQGGIP